MSITLAGLKEYLKMLFKNGTAEMMYFFVGLWLLMTQAPEIINIDVFKILILIGVYLTFAGIALRLGLSLFQFIVLYIGETIEKYKNKQWTLESTIRDHALNIAEDTSKGLFKKTPKSIEDLEKEIAEMEE